MAGTDLHSPETVALFARADKAIAESRRLMASIAEQKSRARGHVHYLWVMAAEMRHRATIRYPSDTVDSRLL